MRQPFIFSLFLLLLYSNKIKSQYCIPDLNCGSNNTISNVSFGSINNSTSSCSFSGYENFSSSVAPGIVFGGKNNLFSATLTAGNTAYLGIWIDLNHNNIFDTTEYTFIGSGNGITVSKNIFLPSLPVPGLTRLRVRRASGSIPVNLSAPCSNVFSAGEIEDYSISITPPPIVIYFAPFADTLYDPVINLTARITQNSIGLDNTSDLKPRLWYKRPGSSGWKSSQGTLISGTLNDGNWKFPVYHDSLNFRRNSCDSVQFYFVVQDLTNPPNLGYLPEPALHSNVNTQTSAPAVLFGYRLKPRLKDTIYVGTSDCRYRSLSGTNGLFQQINARKLEGNLQILIETDLLEDGVHDLKGSSQNGYSITISPATSTIKNIQANNICTNSILLNNAKNILIDGSYNGTGKFLKFKQTFSPYGDTMTNIKIFNSCDTIILKNLLFEDISTHHGGSEYSVLLSGGNNKNIVIANNLFTSTSNLQMAECYIASNHGNNRALIRGNEFNNFLQYGILISSPCDNWIIDSNHFYKSIISTEYVLNVSAVSVKGGGHQIINNYIGGSEPFCAGTPYKYLDFLPYSFAGIQAQSPGGSSHCIISNNQIDNIIFATASNNSNNLFAGIQTIDNKSVIKDNIIGNTGGVLQNISVVTSYIYGIASWGTGPVEIKNNIVSGLKNNVGQSYGASSLSGIYRANNQNGNPIFADSAIITGNTIFNLYNSRNTNSTQSDVGYTVGIITRGGLYNRVEKNTVHSVSVTEGSVTGIAFYDGQGGIPSILQKNRIYNIVNNDNSVSSCCDDDFYNGVINGIAVTGEGSGLDIINNQVSITNNNISNPVSIRGIYEGYYMNIPPPLQKQRVLYNSIYIGGTASQNGGSGCFVTLSQKVKEIYNNLFYNDRIGGTKGHYGIRMLGSGVSATLSGTRSNYNLYAIPDTAAFATYYPLGKIGLGQWKSLTGLDDSTYVSQIINVPSNSLFVNKAAGNLNINSDNEVCWSVNNKALPYIGITDDFDGSGIRPTTLTAGNSDIGSDEFLTYTMAPGGICEGGLKQFTSNITGTSYQWQIKTLGGFLNINNTANYSGTQTGILQISSIPYDWSGQQYRCLVNGTLYSDLFTLIVVQTVTPSVVVSTNNTTVCSGFATTFYAVASSAGNSPAFQWLLNGNNTGTNNFQYTSSSLISGDIISVRITSNAACSNPATATSNSLVMTITNSILPVITISGNTTLTAGQSSLLNTAVTNPGSAPGYQWQDSTSSHSWQNISSATNPSFSYTPAATGNKVRCLLTSNAVCASPATVTSNSLSFTLSPVTAINPVSASSFGIRLFPNPVTGTLYIDSLKISDKWASAEIIQSGGTRVLQPVSLSGRTNIPIDVNRLPSGYYLLRLNRRTGPAALLKFIKQ